jgi:uncharacterized membrane protein
MKRSILLRIITVFAVIGILLACYLLFEQVTRSPFNPCNINSRVNCDAIISGSVSKTFGLPTPLFGLVGYIVILFASLFQYKKTILVTAAGGLLFCLGIAYQELFLLHVICPACILCQVDMLTVFALSLMLVKRSQK